MKSIQYYLVSLALVAGTSFFASCGNDNTTADNAKDDPKEAAEDKNDAKFATNNSERDAQFVVDAADINLSEVNLGKLASTQGMTKEVRELGEKMVADHQKAYDDLSALAKNKNISVPAAVSDMSQKTYNDLAEKKGSDFDKDLCDKMVDGHKDAIDKFEKASKECTDPDIQTWAANMLPSLRMHLDHAMAAREKVKDIQ
jgi:putative membrane protein